MQLGAKPPNLMTTKLSGYMTLYLLFLESISGNSLDKECMNSPKGGEGVSHYIFSAFSKVYLEIFVAKNFIVDGSYEN